MCMYVPFLVNRVFWPSVFDTGVGVISNMEFHIRQYVNIWNTLTIVLTTYSIIVLDLLLQYLTIAEGASSYEWIHTPSLKAEPANCKQIKIPTIGNYSRKCDWLVVHHSRNLSLFVMFQNVLENQPDPNLSGGKSTSSTSKLPTKWFRVKRPRGDCRALFSKLQEFSTDPRLAHKCWAE